MFHPKLLPPFSIILFDALAHGLPFIATDLEFFKEYARKGLGITVKRDPRKFEKALKKLENNYEYFTKIKLNVI